MKIAIPTRGTYVDAHFGHCEAYTVITADDDKNITHTELLPSPNGCGCKSDIAAVLQQKGVTVMLAGNMGSGAVDVLSRHGIDVYRGCSGDVQAVAEAFLAGAVSDSGKSCQQHEQHHQHSHHHQQDQKHQHGHQCNHS